MINWCVGGAKAPTQHAYFIINYKGSVRALGIEALIHLVQTKFNEQTTKELLHEVHMIGEC